LILGDNRNLYSRERGFVDLGRQQELGRKRERTERERERVSEWRQQNFQNEYEQLFCSCCSIRRKLKDNALVAVSEDSQSLWKSPFKIISESSVPDPTLNEIVADVPHHVSSSTGKRANHHTRLADSHAVEEVH
jgi:hypothetical protein